jgi:hypothetical protein
METFGKLTIKTRVLANHKGGKFVTVFSHYCERDDVAAILTEFKENNPKLSTLCRAEFSVTEHFDL